MKIVAISDTHCHFPELPPGDMLIHAGDALNWGHSQEWYQFLSWIKQKAKEYKHVIYVPGNHDIYVQQISRLAQEEMKERGAHLLINEKLDFLEENLSIYGSPWVNHIPHGQWSFMGENEEDMERKLSGISFTKGMTKLLITHSPPYGIRDLCPTSIGRAHLGSQALLTKIKKTKPNVHIFGHIHYSYGEEIQIGTRFYNAAIMNEAYRPINSPTIINL